MRLLGGELKGRQIDYQADLIRATMDKVKDSIFQALGDSVQGKRVLDLFGGSGALSFEAISRGAASAVIIESDKVILKNIIENVKKFGISDRVRAYHNKAEIALRVLGGKRDKFDLIFIDPPYYYEEYDALLDAVFRWQLLSENGLVIIERHKKSYIEANHFDRMKEKKFGGTVIEFLEVHYGEN